VPNRRDRHPGTDALGRPRRGTSIVTIRTAAEHADDAIAGSVGLPAS
jgi:hypothetical protein